MGMWTSSALNSECLGSIGEDMNAPLTVCQGKLRMQAEGRAQGGSAAQLHKTGRWDTS